MVVHRLKGGINQTLPPREFKPRPFETGWLNGQQNLTTGAVVHREANCTTITSKPNPSPYLVTIIDTEEHGQVLAKTPTQQDREVVYNSWTPGAVTQWKWCHHCAGMWTDEELSAMWDQATCVTEGHPTSTFFPEGRINATAYEAAKEICGRCPVKAKCAAQAYDTKQPAGVWGGINFNDRANKFALLAADPDIMAEVRSPDKPGRNIGKRDYAFKRKHAIDGKPGTIGSLSPSEIQRGPFAGWVKANRIELPNNQSRRNCDKDGHKRFATATTCQTCFYDAKWANILWVKENHADKQYP